MLHHDLTIYNEMHNPMHNEIHNKILTATDEICQLSKQLTNILKKKKELKESKTSLILSSISEAVIITDNLGKILEINLAGEKLIDVQFANIKDLNICDLVSVNNKNKTIIKKTDGSFLEVELVTSKNIDNQIIYIIKPTK